MQQRILVFISFVFILVYPASVLAQSESNSPTAGSTIYLPVIMQGQANEQSETQPEDEAPIAEQVATQVVRIYPGADGHYTEMLQELDLFEEPLINGYAVALVSTQELEKLRSAGLQVEVDSERTSRLFTSQAQVLNALSSDLSTTDTIPGFACYGTVEETYSRMAALGAANPTLATWTDIGDSWEKITPNGAAGYDIFVLKLTNSQIASPKPKFFLIAAIHAREYTTAELATRFAEELIAKYNVDPDVTWLLDHFEIHIVPQVNPDGRKKAETGLLWRKNTDNNDGCTTASSWGTDLNRNSSFKWGLPGASTSACDSTYRGPSAASEPEVQAIQAYADAIFPDQRGPGDGDAAPATAENVFITMHSYSELVLYPWGWTTSPAPNFTALQTLGRKFGYFNGYQVCNGPDCLYAVSGVTDDYTYGKQGVASYTFELGQNFFEQCSFFTNNILPKNMPALYYAAKSARRPYQTPAGPDVTNVVATPVTVTAGSPINFTATVDDTRYNSNGWGDEPTQNIQAARYSIDAPSWKPTTLVALNASDSAFDSPIEAVSGSIPSTGLSNGRHLVLVEGQDVAGNWGPPSAFFVYITGSTATPTPTVTSPPPSSTPTLTPTVTPTATVTPPATPTPPSKKLYVSSSSGGSVGGVVFEDEDILQHDGSTGVWSMVFDGSDVEVTVDLDAFTRLTDGTFLLSFDVATMLPGAGTVDDSDVVRFLPASLGDSTAGTFELYFDASDVGLDTNAEDVDGLELLADGRLILSTLGVFGVTGVAGEDEDLIAFTFTGTPGANTTGKWAHYFDGGDVGLAGSGYEDVNGVSIDADGRIYLSTLGNFTVNGVSGDASDVFVCMPSSLGVNTVCSFGPGLYWDGSTVGFGLEDVDDLAVVR